MKYDPIDSELFKRNRLRLCNELSFGGIVILTSNDILPTNADGSMPFVQNSDLFYLTGIDQEETVLVLFPDAHEKRDREVLFIRETSETLSIWEGEKLSKELATRLSGITRVEWASELEMQLARLVPQASKIYLATNEHPRATNTVATRNDRFVQLCRQKYPLHTYERLAPLMQKLRVIKDETEIDYISKAIEITEAGFRRVLQFVQPGVGEWEIEAEYIHEFVRRRSRGFAYQPIIATGKNACVLHYVQNSSLCQHGELLLMDVGAEWANWNADMTRTVPVNGKFTDRQREVYRSVLRVLRHCCQLLRPGILPHEWRRQAIESMEGELIRLGLIDSAEAATQDPDEKPLVRKYFMHGIGHHLGLDVHDVCQPHQAVEENMVFTVEPGIYIREEGIGIRLENNVVVGRGQTVDLFESIPIEPDEIEDIMNAS
jgi:Xaa-Pro aminopeptidase